MTKTQPNLSSNPNKLPFHIGTSVMCIAKDEHDDKTWCVAPHYDKHDPKRLPEGYTAFGWQHITNIEQKSNGQIIVTVIHAVKCKYDKEIWDAVAKHIPKEV